MTSTPALLDNLQVLRRELNSLVTEKMQGILRFTKQKYNENGNRASRLLAIRLKKQQSSNMVQKIKTDKVY